MIGSAPVMPRLHPFLPCAILALPALAAGQPVGPEPADPAAPDADAASGRDAIVVGAELTIDL
jgi:hypothetical protein